MSGETVMRSPMWMALAFIATAVAAVVMHIVSRSRKGKYEGGMKAANTRYARALPEYAARRKRWKAAMVLFEACALAGMASSSVLLARPSQILTEEGDAKKRDIFLCLDVSISIFAQNADLVSSLKELVTGLNGERFGIMLFNSNCIMYVPMTDDYNYVLDQLDTLNTYFKMQAVMCHDMYSYDLDPEALGNMPEPDPDLQEFLQNDPIGFSAAMSEVDAGVIADTSRGSSLIGEGLATCLFSFPHLDDEDRTRAIIFSTDNDPQAFNEDVDLQGAAALCKKHDVTVYGIYPSETDLPLGHSDYDGAKAEFEAICDETGGVSYVAGSGHMDVSEAVADIKKKEAITVKEPSKRYQVDTPAVPYMVLLVSVVALLATIGVMRPW